MTPDPPTDADVPPGVGPSPRDPISDEILLAILLDLEEGREPDAQALCRRHPGHEATVARLCGIASGYASLRASLVDSDAPRTLERGTRLGDFEIQAPIGRGGMGVVYRARQCSLGGRPVALKVQSLDDLPERARKRFQREAMAAAALHHPHLAEVYGFGTHGKHLYYAMELVEGPSLREQLDALVARPGMRGDPQVVRRVVQQIVGVSSALASVHRAGLVHRDVKPSNILLRAPPTGPETISAAPAILVDFGLVRAIDQHTRTEFGTGSATPSYASPEQLVDLDVDARSDVFSLGATLHDMLAGRLPGDRPLAAHGLEPLHELMPGFDKDLSAVVERATDVDPRWRYADGGELHADLESWLAGESVRARRSPLHQRLRRWVQRNPTRVFRAVVVMSVLALAGWCGAVFWRFGEVRTRAALALERGDVVALVDALRELPGIPAALLLHDPELVQLRARVGHPADPLVLVREALSRGAVDAALLASAVRLRTSELDSEPLLATWFASQLRTVAAAGSDTAERRRFATVLAARLMLERPELGASESATGRRLREPLAGLFTSPDVERFEQLHALSALGNCAQPQQIGSVLEWLRPRSVVSEETRVGLMALEGIVRRALAQGKQDQVPFGDIWEALSLHQETTDRLEYQRGGAAGMEYEVRSALTRLRRALLVAQRASSRQSEAQLGLLRLRLLERAPATLESSCLDVRSLQVELAVTSGGAELCLALVHGIETPVATRPFDAGELGWACGATFEPALTSLSRDVVRQQALRDGVDPGDELSRFERHRVRGIEESSGQSQELEPDPDTLLGAPPLKYKQLQTVWVGPSRPPDDLLASLPLGDPARDPSFAQWEFRTTPVRMSGTARSAHGREADWRAEGTGGYLRFGRFGTAQAEFEFEVDPSAAFQPLALCLWHQIGARPHYPGSGSVMISIELDGSPMAVLAVPGVDTVLTRLRVPHSRLAVGQHVLRLRQLESSTTTYRLLWMGLRDSAD
jgi:Protein kinase domain